VTEVVAGERQQLAAAGRATSRPDPSDAGQPEPRPAATARTWRRFLPLVVVAVVASPIAIAAASLVGDAWFPVGDMAHQLFRISQVGTRATPLVGAETVKGWAHPGPLEFYLAAPIYRLTDGDPRSLMWTASLVNVASIGGIAAVAWRRGGWPLLLGVGTLVAVLVHSLGPELTTSIWNPFLPLLPFLLTVLLVWDAALGDRRALVWAALSATLAAQTHLAFATLTALLVVWLVGWSFLWPRLLARERGTPNPGLPPRLLRGWLRPLWPGLALVGLLWVPPLLDALFDLRNPWHILTSLATPPDTVGPVDAIGLVGRYVRPDGPWIGGAEPSVFFSVVGSGPLPLVAALGILAGCLHVGRRRGFVDVVALASLTLTLVIGSIPATSQIVLPIYSYLTQFLKLVGGLVWFTLAWTVWRLVEPHVRALWRRQAAVGGLVALALVASAAWTWGDATRLPTPNAGEEAMVQDLRAELGRILPRDQRIRVEYRGDALNISGPGVIYWLIHDGYDVLTSDGAHGLKWGHAHRWQPRESYDMLLTVAVQEGGGGLLGLPDAFTQCQNDRFAELVSVRDQLSPGERQWLDDFRLRRWGDPSSVTTQETRRAERLEANSLRIGIFEGPRICARNPRLEPRDDDT
jgi:hypothetical protein